MAALLLKSPQRLAIILSGCLISFAILIGIGLSIQHHVDRTRAHLLLTHCSQTEATAHIVCLQKTLQPVIHDHPTQIKAIFHGIVLLGYQAALPFDARWYGELAHKVGAQFIRDHYSLSEAVTYCSLSFKQGCIHGAVMQAALDQTDLDKLATLCQQLTPAQQRDHTIYLNCLHGLGHSYMLMHSSTEFVSTLDQCLAWSTVAEQHACGSGVMMEYMVGSRHEHMVMATTFAELPCAQLSTDWQALCYASAGSYRQYRPTGESFISSYQWCQHVPTSYQDTCFNAVSERLVLASSGRRPAAIQTCLQLQSPAWRDTCEQQIRQWSLRYWWNALL